MLARADSLSTLVLPLSFLVCPDPTDLAHTHLSALTDVAFDLLARDIRHTTT